MKIVVIGGNGLIGSKLIPILRGRGHEAVAASPQTGVDTLTGEGLAEALKGAAVVVDVSNSPSFEDAAVLHFFETATGNLLAAERAAGVKYHVAVSVVGADRSPDSGYMRAKVAQERMIKAGGVHYTILRATQFFEFVGRIADSATIDDTVRVPHALIQPMAGDDVASAVAAVVLDSPVNGIVEVGGPEAFRFDEFVRIGLAAQSDRRKIVVDPTARYFGEVLDEHTLTPGKGARLATTRFQDWLRRSLAAAR